MAMAATTDTSWEIGAAATSVGMVVCFGLPIAALATLLRIVHFFLILEMPSREETGKSPHLSTPACYYTGRGVRMRNLSAVVKLVELSTRSRCREDRLHTRSGRHTPNNPYVRYEEP